MQIGIMYILLVFIFLCMCSFCTHNIILVEYVCKGVCVDFCKCESIKKVSLIKYSYEILLKTLLELLISLQTS